jgi:hypothetical protein
LSNKSSLTAYGKSLLSLRCRALSLWLDRYDAVVNSPDNRALFCAMDTKRKPRGLARLLSCRFI